MAMKCNIDRRGQQLRGLWGVANLVLAIVCLCMYFLSPWPHPGWIFAGILLFFCGVFGIFEAYFSWCALRAMKIKTKW
jgi:drug/metabolite transporter (DMT)-like permease